MEYVSLPHFLNFPEINEPLSNYKDIMLQFI